MCDKITVGVLKWLSCTAKRQSGMALGGAPHTRGDEAVPPEGRDVQGLARRHREVVRPERLPLPARGGGAVLREGAVDAGPLGLAAHREAVENFICGFPDVRSLAGFEISKISRNSYIIVVLTV